MPPTQSPVGHPQRATLRHIAERAQVSAMTVSRALANRPRVAAATRRRILRLADELGYRPDPEISKLMHHLRSRVRPRFQSVICGLTTRPAGREHPYFLALLAGAMRQAERRGYGFLLWRTTAKRADWAGLHGMLRARGVQGVLLLPQREPVDLTGLLRWESFSVVSATASVLAPQFPRVNPHHFGNALLLCRRLAALGYRRPGLITTQEHDQRVGHHFAAACTWHGLNEAPELVRPLILREESREAVARWFQRERPDVIVATEEKRLRQYARWLGLRIPGPIGLASTNVQPGSTLGWTGIDERPEEIGVAAVEVLAGLIERRVHGIPEAPTTTLLPGSWVRGRTCRR